jgi:hypothetical protein
MQQTLVERPDRGEPAGRAVLEDGGHGGLFFVAAVLPSPPATNPRPRHMRVATETRPRQADRLRCTGTESVPRVSPNLPGALDAAILSFTGYAALRSQTGR